MCQGGSPGPEGVPSLVAPFLCHPYVGARGGPQGGAGVAGTCQLVQHPGLYPCYRYPPEGGLPKGPSQGLRGCGTVHATTIIGVRKDGQVAMAGDGQVTFGNSMIMKQQARKV